MSQGFKVTKEKKGNDNDWMDTYADAITLLMAFFVVLLSMSSMNAKKYDYMVEVISQGVNKSTFADKGEEASKAVTDDVRSFIPKPLPALPEQSYLNVLSDVVYETKSGGSTFQIKSSLLFVPNSATIRDDAMTVLKSLSDHLKAVNPDNFEIIIESHVDSNISLNKRRYPDKWAFTSARAMMIRDELERIGVKKSIMYIAAFADTQPAGRNGLYPIPSEDPADDRRIVIRIRQKI
jgi:chemotaxis protein MotB